MKKAYLKPLSLILFAAMLLSMLPACSNTPNLLKLEGAERADAFFDLANRDPDEVYSVELEMLITGSLYGVRLEAEGESKTTYIGYRGNDPIYHTEASSTITVGSDGAETVQKTETLRGFRDGKLYEMSDRDGTKTALVSSVSAEEYRAHQELLTGFSDEELEDLHKSATVKECTQNEDGTWTASFSGYPEESVLSLIDYCFDPTVLILDGYKVKDILFTVGSDEKFLPTDWSYEIVFERTDSENLYAEPVAKTEIEFTDIGTAKAPEIDLSSYTEVEGLTDLQIIRKILGEMFLADSGSFTANSEQTVNVASATEYNQEIDEISFKTENGRYTFNIAASVNPQKVSGSYEADIVYADGIFEMTGKDISTVTQEMSDSAARAYISRLFDPAGLSNALISDIALSKNGNTHLFTLAAPDYAALEQSLSALGATNFKAEATVGVDYEDGKLKEYEYILSLTAKVNGQTLTVEVKSTVTFDIGTDNKM